MKIGQLAQATGTQVETIRYYEKVGLLPLGARTDANYRMYDASHVQRLAFIRHCRCLDMTLDEIRVLLRTRDAPGDSCGEVDQLLEAHIGHVASRIRELRALEKELKALRASCAAGQVAADCGILQGLQQAAHEHDHRAAAGASQHLGGVHAKAGAVGR
jgi:Cd(II)/Pb(II)-responsive transcriptional regulator